VKGVQLNREDATAAAEDWIAAWNAHDLYAGAQV
jgi:hypothetical protein